MIWLSSGDPSATCNQAYDGPVATLDPRAPGEVELDPRSNGIAALRARNGGHRGRLELAPPLPDLARLRPRMTVEGTWRLGIDDTPAVVGGFWSVERCQDRAELVLDVDQGWRPAGLPPLMTAVPGLPRSSAADRPRPTAGRERSRSGTGRP